MTETKEAKPKAKAAEPTSLIKFKLPEGAKVFTSDGKKYDGAVCELPKDEAKQYIAQELAYPAEPDED